MCFGVLLCLWNSYVLENERCKKFGIFWVASLIIAVTWRLWWVCWFVLLFLSLNQAVVGEGYAHQCIYYYYCYCYYCCCYYCYCYYYSLVDSSSSRHLISYIDLSGCALITDTTLLRIAWASTPLQTTPTSCCDCSCGDKNIYDKGGGGIGDVVKKNCELKCLVLSGCHQITDVGLRWV